jgi:hypothetical protein
MSLALRVILPNEATTNGVEAAKEQTVQWVRGCAFGKFMVKMN